MKLSILIHVYNNASTIDRALQSVVQQSCFLQTVVYVADDHSTDDSLARTESWARQFPNIVVIRGGENLGVMGNYERLAAGIDDGLVFLLEADDRWTDHRRLELLSALMTSSGAQACCSNFDVVTVTNGKETMRSRVYSNRFEMLTAAQLVHNNIPGTFSNCGYTVKAFKSALALTKDKGGFDWLLNVVVADHGAGIAYHPRCMLEKINNESCTRLSMPVAVQERIIESNLETMTAVLTSAPARQAAIDALDRRRAAHGSPAPEGQEAPLIIPARQSLTVDLVIIDDVYPHPQSAFRRQEFDAYLRHFPNAHVLSSGNALKVLYSKDGLETLISNLAAEEPQLGQRVHAFHAHRRVTARLGYLTFAANVWANLSYLESNGIPFVFTLYPGGGFSLEDATSDSRLRRIFESPCFRKVIVTQTVTHSYLLQKKLCRKEDIEFIFGVVTPEVQLRTRLQKKRFGFGKSVLDICFTAHKYTPTGRDKGYDFFLDVAREIAKQLPACRFHVVGGYGPRDLPITGLEGRIFFYGQKDPHWFPSFYADKDIILLANVPFLLVKGAFDGFPTGCGSDAMLNGLALLATDPLKLNVAFEDQKELVIIPRDVKSVAARIRYLHDNPAMLRDIGEAGLIRARDVYSTERQIAPRIRLLEREMNKPQA